MSKLNSLGLELLDLKVAINSDYPAIVLKALMQSADELLNQNQIDQETHYLLTEPVFPLQEFKTFCLSKAELCKSEEELLSMYESKRVKLEAALIESVTRHQLSVENYINDEQIIIVRTYHFGRAELEQYFGIEKEADQDALMGRQRFIERFIALRYPKIMNDFLRAHQNTSELFQLAHSGVFHDEDRGSYAIELLIKIRIQDLEEVDPQIFVKPVQHILRQCDRWFNQSLGKDGHFYLTPSQAPSTEAEVETKSQPKPKTSPSFAPSEPQKMTEEIHPQPTVQVESVPEVSEVSVMSFALADSTAPADFSIEVNAADLSIELPEMNFELEEVL